MTTPRHSSGSNYVYDYSLDVLTNGSEALEPTVFLSVSRRSKTNESSCSGESIEQEESSSGSLVRYAVLGLSDMTARLAADQRISWANTKALFCHNNHRHEEGTTCCPYAGVNGGGLWGLPGILLALNQAGAPDLTVVTGNEEDASCTEAIVQLLQAHKKHPQVRISALPLTEEGQSGKWWKVYEDPYLIVHGTCHGRLEHLVYLFTCRRHQKIPNYTVAVLSCPHSWQTLIDVWSIAESRLVLENGHRGSIVSIQLVLAVGDDAKRKDTFLSDAQVLLPKAAIFFCQPQERDQRILLRAMDWAQAWHNALPNNIVWRRPPNNSSNQSNGIALNGAKLFSCSSVQCTQPANFVDRTVAIRKRNGTIVPENDVVQSLKRFLDVSVNGMGESNDTNEIDLDDLDEDSDDGDDSDDSNQIDTRHDESVIDIDSGERSNRESTGCDLNDERTNHTGPQPINNHPLPGVTNIDCPHLLVLGTGCATPSPLRGSSGYGLLLHQLVERTRPIDTPTGKPSEALLLTAILECGEGTVNALQRQLPLVDCTITNSLENHLRQVKFIWISHAHYDHYGGLPALVSNINEARMRDQRRSAKEDVGQQSRKRSRLEPSEPPVLVVAPRMVLDYLTVALRSKNQSKKQGGTATYRLFQGYTHQQYQQWWPALASIQIARTAPQSSPASYAYRPFAFWTNVLVLHSCRNAFGFVMGVRVPGSGFTGDQCGVAFHADTAATRTITLAYSGDTRPCWGFVEQCRRDCSAFSGRDLCYLLHEASFDEADQAQALEKKHSSLSEALKVAEDVKAQKIILTHFSQRYPSYPPMKLPSGTSATVFAMDGMLISLL